jgi:hypothetical protein
VYVAFDTHAIGSEEEIVCYESAKTHEIKPVDALMLACYMTGVSEC